jgi:hypothetical protein
LLFALAKTMLLAPEKQNGSAQKAKKNEPSKKLVFPFSFR